MAQSNFEWYSLHINSVALREMAQHKFEWYSIHTNGVASHEMAQHNVEWYNVHTNDVVLREMAVVISICCLNLPVENRQTEEFLDHSANFRKIKITL